MHDSKVTVFKLLFQDLGEGLMGHSGPENRHVNTQDIWVDKAKVCISMGLYQAAWELLSEASLVSVVSYI